MKISSIVDIVDGELLNSPSISFINNISSDAKKVKTSDMFIAKNIEDLQIAIANGAYAVIFEKDLDIETLITARKRSKEKKPDGFCPKCGKPISKNDKFCSKCGRTL